MLLKRRANQSTAPKKKKKKRTHKIHDHSCLPTSSNNVDAPKLSLFWLSVKCPRSLSPPIFLQPSDEESTVFWGSGSHGIHVSETCLSDEMSIQLGGIKGEEDGNHAIGSMWDRQVGPALQRHYLTDMPSTSRQKSHRLSRP